MSNYLTKLLFKVLKAYNVSVTYRTIEREVNTHPKYPSMQCISDALDGWKVMNVVMNLTVEKLHALDVPVIAHLKKGEFIWVTQVTDSNVQYWSANGNEKTESLERFEQEWSGVALAIKGIADAGESDYSAVRQSEIKEKIFKLLIAGVLVVLVAVLTCFSWANDSSLPLLSKLLLLVINGVGCYVSYILIRQEKRQSDALSDKFCKVGKYIDCKKVTASKYSKLFGFISWAELGAAYFCSMLIWIAIAPFSAGWLPPIWWLSFIVLPFTLWSLATQGFVIRKWCLFCCTVVILLWVNAAVLLVSCSQPAIVSIPETAMAALLFIVFIVAVMETGKTIGSKSRSYSKQRETAKIKYSLLTLHAHILETAHVTDNTGFTFDAPVASQEIGLYVSISCSHCKTALKEFHRLTEIYSDFRYRLIFSVKSDDFDDNMNRIICHFINLYKALNRKDFFIMLDTWYAMPQKTLETLQKAFPVSPAQDFQIEMDAMYQFSRHSKIGYTPAILLNGRILSQIYSHKDLYGIARTIHTEV